MTYQFNPNILREYDIRGTFGVTLSVEDATALGKKVAVYLKKQGLSSLCLSRDGRQSSPILHQALQKGLLSSGITVIDIGIAPTPMLYYAVKVKEADAGIMITGSHNPADDNGFKITLSNRPLYGQDILDIAAIDETSISVQTVGNLIPYDADQDYINRLLLNNDLKNAKRLKIAWDPGNGASCSILKQLCAHLPHESIIINDTLDGTFPNHDPDPTVPKNLQQLIEAILSHGCDLGIAFDGDADRIVAVDNKGRQIQGDQLLIILATDLLKKHPGATIITDVKASQVLLDSIKQAGGNPILWKTGHSLIKAKMKETNAILAGEMSGHIFYADDYYGYDDGLYAAVRLIQLLQKSPKSLADLYDDLPKRPSTPEIRISCPDDKKFSVIREIKKILEKTPAIINDVDGIRIESDKGWWLLRASNTQPALVARCEAIDEASLVDLVKELESNLKDYNLFLPS